MYATRYARCDPYEGDKYQEMAFRHYVADTKASSVLPWIWFTPICGTSQCLQFEHIEINAPIRIAYPALLCIYCGLPGGTKDHLLPESYTGPGQRKYVAVVPSCGQCNCAIGDACVYRITERRQIAHDWLRKRFAKVLVPPVPYKDFDGYLRSYVKAAHAKRSQLLARLSWPHDLDFDLRAFQKSGIEDPYAAGLI